MSKSNFWSKALQFLQNKGTVILLNLNILYSFYLLTFDFNDLKKGMFGPAQRWAVFNLFNESPFCNVLVETKLAQVIQSGSQVQVGGVASSTPGLEDQVEVLQQEIAIQTALFQMYEEDDKGFVAVFTKLLTINFLDGVPY
jgi:hypothetical protein